MTSPAPLAVRLAEVHRHYRLPALGAAIFGHDGDLEVAVVGTRVRDGESKAGIDDRWHIGSCGKALTASLFARLVERGSAAWGTALPDLFPQPEVGIDGGWKRVTIDDVLTHRAGLPGNLGREAFRSAMHDTRPIVEQRAAVVADALARPPRKPGPFRYSNLGYIVVGAAIERITGCSWEHTVCEELLVPLGIRSAGSVRRSGRSRGATEPACEGSVAAGPSTPVDQAAPTPAPTTLR